MDKSSSAVSCWKIIVIHIWKSADLLWYLIICKTYHHNLFVCVCLAREQKIYNNAPISLYSPRALHVCYLKGLSLFLMRCRCSRKELYEQKKKELRNRQNGSWRFMSSHEALKADQVSFQMYTSHNIRRDHDRTSAELKCWPRCSWIHFKSRRNTRLIKEVHSILHNPLNILKQ